MVQEPKDNNNLSGGRKHFADRRECRSKTSRTQGNAAKRWCFAPCVLSLEATMDQYIGLDVSLKDTAISIRQDGKRIWRGKRPSD